MKELTLFDKQSEVLSKIHHEGDMVSLTDLWKEAGSPQGKDPAQWVRQDVATQLIETVSSMLNMVSNHIMKTKKGKGGGTWGHKQIALAKQ